MKKIFVFVFVLFYLCCFAYAQADSLRNIKDKVATVKDKAIVAEQRVTSVIDSGISDAWAHIGTYFTNLIKEESAKQPPRLETTESIVVTVVNLLLSLFCLIFAVYFVTKASVPKKYVWFLFIFNITWFIMTLIAKVIWEILEYLVINLQPDLQEGIYNNFFIAFVVISILIYIWLLARTFGLNFFGASGSFVVAHTAYILTAFIIFSVYNPAIKPTMYTLLKESMGIRVILRGYTQDMKNITTPTSPLSFIKIKYFHI